MAIRLKDEPPRPVIYYIAVGGRGGEGARAGQKRNGHRNEDVVGDLDDSGGCGGGGDGGDGDGGTSCGGGAGVGDKGLTKMHRGVRNEPIKIGDEVRSAY